MWILNAFPGGFHTNSLFCPLPQAPRLDENTVHSNSFSNIVSNKELGAGRGGCLVLPSMCVIVFVKKKKKNRRQWGWEGRIQDCWKLIWLQRENSRLELLIKYPGFQVSVREDLPTIIKCWWEHLLEELKCLNRYFTASPGTYILPKSCAR